MKAQIQDSTYTGLEEYLNILNDYFPAKKLKHDLSRYLAKS